MVEIHLTLRLRASPRVHDGAETPSTITLKQASTIAEMRTQWYLRPRRGVGATKEKYV